LALVPTVQATASEPACTAQPGCALSSDGIPPAPIQRPAAARALLPTSIAVVTNCTTAGYYATGAQGTGLGTALAGASHVFFLCIPVLSGGPGPYTIVPQDPTNTFPQPIIVASGTLALDGADGGRFDVTISGGSSSQLLQVNSGTALSLANLTLRDG